MKLRETRSESSFSLDLRAASSSHLVALCFKALETFIVLIVRLCVYYLVLVWAVNVSDLHREENIGGQLVGVQAEVAVQQHHSQLLLQQEYHRTVLAVQQHHGQVLLQQEHHHTVLAVKQLHSQLLLQQEYHHTVLVVKQHNGQVLLQQEYHHTVLAVKQHDGQLCARQPCH